MPGIPERVRQLIQSAGSNQRDIAAEIGLDATKLSKSLSGSRRFTSVDLAALADHFTVTVDWLITGEEPALAVAARSTGGTAQAAVRMARDFADMRDGLTELGYPQNWRPIAFHAGGLSFEEGDRLAREALIAVESADRSVAETDLPGLIEAVFGVDVTIARLGANLDGIAAFTESTRLMVVNTSSMPGRQRFTMAHALAHLLLGDDQSLRIDADIHSESGKRDPSEIRANAFGASLLMPESVLHERIGRSRLDLAGLARLAYDLRVTPTALSYRLRALGLIDPDQASELARTSESRGASLCGETARFANRVFEANQPRPPGLLVRDSYAAYTAGDITLRPYARLIGADLDELRRSLEFNEVIEAP